MKVKKYKAYWHAWHEPYLINFLTAEEYANRVEEIKMTKPENEISTRLRLFQAVKGKLPAILEEAYAKWDEAYAKWDEAYAKQKEANAEWEEAITKQKEAYAKWVEAYAKRVEAYAKWDEARAKWKEAYAKCLPQIEKLHAKECGCKEWDGEKIVFPEAGDKKCLE